MFGGESTTSPGSLHHGKFLFFQLLIGTVFGILFYFGWVSRGTDFFDPWTIVFDIGGFPAILCFPFLAVLVPGFLAGIVTIVERKTEYSKAPAHWNLRIVYISLYLGCIIVTLASVGVVVVSYQ
jgi:hypothetical protein